MADWQSRQIHVKQLTANEEFFRYHVHLDSRGPVPVEVEVLLSQLGFYRAHISINCFAYANAPSPNGSLSEAMFRGTEPSTWTLKTNDRALCLRAYKTTARALHQYGIEGYVEAETVHWDGALTRVCKPFDVEAYERICPLIRRGDRRPQFLDAEGRYRAAPFVAEQRFLDRKRGERAPVLELHLSVNFDMVANTNIALLLHGMGLVSYEIPKVCALPNRELVTDEKGGPLIISERPLTLRFANPCRTERRRWVNDMQKFIRGAYAFVEILEELGGFEPPRSFGAHFPLYPVTFKIESLCGFHARVNEESHLPPVLGGFKGTPERGGSRRIGTLAELCAELTRRAPAPHEPART